MPEIKSLPQEVADQIAAGEVVERPASIVKEVLENALDANASHIVIEVKKGGVELIKISDDGHGMDLKNALKCFERSATSKVDSIDDVYSIGSFGFRGEALAAISSVAKVTLNTATKESEEGFEVVIKGGIKVSENPTAPIAGASFEITDLFYNVPARKEYLKTAETEYRAIYKIIQSMALAHWGIGFELIKDGKKVLNLPAVEDSRMRVESLLKKKDLLALPETPIPGGYVSGFVSSPDQAVANKNSQQIFVNQRPIEDYKIAYAVREAYVQTCGIEKHLHPVFVVFVQIDPLLVDVNVHPRKTEVKFSDPYEVFGGVKGAVMALLKNTDSKPNTNLNQTYTPDPVSKSELRQGQNFNQIIGGSSRVGVEKGPSQGFGSSFRNQSQERDYKLTQPTTPSIFTSHSTTETAPLENEKTISPDPLRLIGQAQNRYIIAENESGIYWFDQHALHERQRFEVLYKQWEQKKMSRQPLLIPYEIELEDSQIQLLEEHQEVLAKAGFLIDFGENKTLEIHEVPELCTESNFEHLIQDFVGYLEDFQTGENFEQKMVRKILEYASCRGAVMYGDKMNREEMENLLADFHTTPWKNLCPHGRPNHLFFETKDIDGWFHR